MAQAQGISGFTSQLPPREPPQGPLSRLLAQRATGQMLPVKESMQSPQPWHFSRQMPGSSKAPKKVVFNAGKTGSDEKTSAKV